MANLVPTRIAPRRLAALVAAPLLLSLAASSPTRASTSDSDLPVLAGPIPVGPADVRVDAAAYDVAFGEGARMAHVGISFTVTSPSGGELALAFGARGAWRLEADVDGAPLAVERPPDLPLPGGPYDDRVLLRVPLLPGIPAAVHVRVLGDTAGLEREATLTYPQATFLLNRLLDQPRGRAVSFQPGPLLAGAPDLRMRVETISPQRPEAPVTGEAIESAGRTVVEGSVVADLAAPVEVAAVEGDYQAPRNWGIVFGIGAAVDWARTQRIDRDPDTGAETGRTWVTLDAGDPASRVWFRGLFAWAFRPKWRMEVGVEGDFAGALELPLTFTWFPQDGRPGFFDYFGDYHFFFGAALQLINDRMPEDHGFDPRPFLRLGGGVRFLVVTLDVAYEFSPPVGDWDGRWGGFEHKLFITFPFTF
ncbi:MAG: hypothetical protein HY905_19645 [Deltaproteobacteria bacterium]|nr:hypothetical protein [Deltaproteobacteria bacterium]